MTILVVRHAHAGKRSTYQGDDRERHLSAQGRTRALALVDQLATFHPRRILSSPYQRCVQTVEPLATALGLRVEEVDELGEQSGVSATDLVASLMRDGNVLCTHGDVADMLLDVITPDSADSAQGSLRLQKGDVWVIEDVRTRLVIVDHLRTSVKKVRSAEGG